MIDEQNTQPNASPNDANDKPVDNEKESTADSYYDVDLPKKDSDTAIGDGEMRNEGLMNLDESSDTATFSEGSTEEQDEAKNHDSEG